MAPPCSFPLISLLIFPYSLTSYSLVFPLFLFLFPPSLLLAMVSFSLFLLSPFPSPFYNKALKPQTVSVHQGLLCLLSPAWEPLSHNPGATGCRPGALVRSCLLSTPTPTPPPPSSVVSGLDAYPGLSGKHLASPLPRICLLRA